nr:hypothetical protein [uncultured bacterium]
MQSTFEAAQQLLQQYGYLGSWLAGFSVLALLLSALALPHFIAAIPDDYFSQHTKAGELRNSLSIGEIAILALKNVIGTILILSGIAMLVLPGQGLLTLFAGIVLAEFPGKRRLVRKIIRVPAVLDTLNYFRRKKNKPEFELDKIEPN